MPANPFTYRSPVWGEEFYDREQQIDWIQENIRNPLMLSMSIVAPSRMGATSFLKRFCEVIGPQIRRERRYRYIDLLGIHNRADMYQALTQALGFTGNTPAALNQAAQRVNHQTYIVLDGFECLLNKKSEFNADFFALLRSIAQNRIALVIASSLPLADLQIPWDRNSTFHQIFASIRLPPWSKNLATIYLRDKSREAGREFSTKEINFILNWSRNKTPYHLQVLAYHCFESKKINFIQRIRILANYFSETSKGKKQGESFWRSKMHLVIQSILLLTFISVLVLWAIFGNLKSYTTLACNDKNPPSQYLIVLEYPRFLANGDDGNIQITITSQITTTQHSNPIAILQFDQPIQMVNDSSNRISFSNLSYLEQKTSRTVIHRTGNYPIKLDIAVSEGDNFILCNAIDKTIPEIKYGPIPYLNRAVVFIGTGLTGIPSLVIAAIAKLLEKKVIGQ